MIMSIWSILRDMFTPMSCRKCGYKSLSAFRMIHHLSKEYNIKPTKRDAIFLIKHNFITITLSTLVLIPLLITGVVLKIVLLPFYYLFELL